VGLLVTEKMDGVCRYCFWHVNLPRCRPEKMITHSGTCLDWRLRKLTVAERAKEATVMKAAHVKDVARKVEEKKKTTRGKK
jgi:hypothetical protein